jgi:hypothetical protein
MKIHLKERSVTVYPKLCKKMKLDNKNTIDVSKLSILEEKISKTGKF